MISHREICQGCQFFYDFHNRADCWNCGFLPRTEENLRLTQKFNTIDEENFIIPKKCVFSVEHLLLEGKVNNAL